MFSFVTKIGAPFTLFFVYTLAAVHNTSQVIKAKSSLLLFFLIPQCIPLALNPFDEHIPKLTSFVLSPKMLVE